MIGTTQGISSKASVLSRIRYICKDNEYTYTHNMLSDTEDFDGLKQEFLNNSKYLNSRSKNILLSETLSMPIAPHISKEDQAKILKQIMQFHIDNRKLQDHLGLISIHTDRNHIHAHGLFSSNPMYGSKNLRVSKKEYLKQQQALEEYRNVNFKFLPKTNHYSQVLDRRIKLAEGRMKYLRKAITKKDELKSRIQIALTKSTQQEFRKYLKENNLILYKRGAKTIGVRDIVQKRNYRLNTIEKGLRDKYIAYEKNLALKQSIKRSKQQTNNNQQIKQKRGRKI
jgi:DNA-dependent RNA polymerase auxiliary subunit epsilon